MNESDWLYLIVDAAKRQIVCNGHVPAITGDYDEAVSLLERLSANRKDKLLLSCYVRLNDIAQSAELCQT